MSERAVDLIPVPAADSVSQATSKKAFVIPLSTTIDGDWPQVFAVRVDGRDLFVIDVVDDTVTVNGQNTILTRVLQETHLATEFAADETTASLTMDGTIPAGAYLLMAKVVVDEGFAEDVSATLSVGDGTDVDRYGTADVFATETGGVVMNSPGDFYHATAVQPVLAIETATAASLIVAGAGSVTVAIYYLAT